MTSQMRINKEIIKKSNTKLIANPKLVNKERKKNFDNSLKKYDVSKNDINSLNEKKFKLEIEKALISKEKQISIIQLIFYSIFIFILVVGSSLVSILYNIIIKNKIK